MSGCAFCEEFNSKPRVCSVVERDRVVWEDEDFAILPTVGSFVFGYLMLMPKDHTYSYAQLEPELMKKVGPLSGAICRAIMSVIPGNGTEVLVAEHGALNCQIKGSQCCDHAHLHFIPVPRFATEIENYYCKYQGTGNMKYVSWEALPEFKDTDYVSYYKYLHHHREQMIDVVGPIVVTGTKYPSQACRQAAAIANRVPDKWDWRKFPGEMNMQYSIDVFSRYFKKYPPLQEASIGTRDDSAT